MQARSSIIEHPLGFHIETPLMVPSFSSKGFAFKKKLKQKDADVSEVAEALEFSKEFLTEILLVSAYDIFYGHIPFTEEHVCTDITMVDSGGYESGGAYDLSATSKYNYDLKDWKIEQLEEVLNKWPEHKAAIIVSFDHGDRKVSLTEQINSANELFVKYPRMLSNFLIKPETKEQKYVQVSNVLEKIDDLKQFKIVGITEREIGNSILQRMLNISTLRKALDSKGNTAPIHVFGSLDPVTSILYFLAGAEIFDGLTWLKYSYYNSSAIYTSNFGVLNNELGINVKDSLLKSITISKNTYYLEKMKYIMKDFLKNNDFGVFNELGGNGFSEVLERSYRTFESNIK